MDRPELDNLTNEVAQTKDVQKSAVTLLNGLKTRLDKAIADLAAQGVSNDTLNSLSSDLDVSTNDLAAAVAANTVAE